MTAASAARRLQPGNRMQGGVQVVPQERPQVRALLVAQLRASGACFLGVLFAGMMEWHWGRERNRRAGAFSPPGDSH